MQKWGLNCGFFMTSLETFQNDCRDVLPKNPQLWRRNAADSLGVQSRVPSSE
jgi:hypothetical protein